MTLKELQKLIKKNLTININIHDQFYACFSGVEVKCNGCLSSTFGTGNTISEAIKAYCEVISNKEIAIDSYTENRVDISLSEITV